MQHLENLYLSDPQRHPSMPCPRCGGCTYPPSYHCIRCERSQS